MATEIIEVNAEINYPVIIGKGVTSELVPLIGDQVAKILLVHPETLESKAEEVAEVLRSAGYEVFVAVIPDAEAAKTVDVLAFGWRILGQSGFTRSDAIVTLGGGATTDLGGFLAASWLRGMKVYHIATTLLGMVDAAVGGKTGINTAEGKNLVGAFHSPSAVLCDVDYLATLPTFDFVAGLGEVIKTGFIADQEILRLVEENAASLKNWPADWENHSAVVQELISRSVAVKARVVSADLKESSLREILNYGHTFAHAIEQSEKYSWRHGAAVSVGMVYAAELARLVGKLSDADVQRHRDILTSVGLPVSYTGSSWDKLLTVMKRDKKSRGALLRFVILEGIGNPVRLEGPDPTLLVSAYGEVS